jgi:hypothetical protein
LRVEREGEEGSGVGGASEVGFTLRSFGPLRAPQDDSKKQKAPRDDDEKATGASR